MGLFITIDPGLNGTGWAIWSQVPKSKCVPISTGVMHRADTKSDWFDAGLHLTNMLIGVLDDNDCLRGRERTEAFIEYPGYWEGSPVSQTSARSGSLVKLACLVGMFADRLTISGCRVTFITPQQWKGNLPKEIIHKEIFKRIGKRYREHEADAVGMGLYMKGVL